MLKRLLTDPWAATGLALTLAGVALIVLVLVSALTA